MQAILDNIDAGVKAGLKKARKADVRFCSWTWDTTEQRWLSGCGYGFAPASDRDHTGAFLPFPFCPYCGRQIRKPNASLERAAVADTLEDIVRCENCGGSGVISFNPNLNPNSFPGTATTKCTRCGGTGIEDAPNARLDGQEGSE